MSEGVTEADLDEWFGAVLPLHYKVHHLYETDFKELVVEIKGLVLPAGPVEAAAPGLLDRLLRRLAVLSLRSRLTLPALSLQNLLTDGYPVSTDLQILIGYLAYPPMYHAASAKLQAYMKRFPNHFLQRQDSDAIFVTEKYFLESGIVTDKYIAVGCMRDLLAPGAHISHLGDKLRTIMRKKFNFPTAVVSASDVRGMAGVGKIPRACGTTQLLVPTSYFWELLKVIATWKTATDVAKVMASVHTRFANGVALGDQGCVELVIYTHLGRMGASAQTDYDNLVDATFLGIRELPHAPMKALKGPMALLADAETNNQPPVQVESPFFVCVFFWFVCLFFVCVVILVCQTCYTRTIT